MSGSAGTPLACGHDESDLTSADGSTFCAVCAVSGSTGTDENDFSSTVESSVNVNKTPATRLVCKYVRCPNAAELARVRSSNEELEREVEIKTELLDQTTKARDSALRQISTLSREADYANQQVSDLQRRNEELHSHYEQLREALTQAIAEIDGSPFQSEPWGWGMAFRLPKWRALAAAGQDNQNDYQGQAQESLEHGGGRET